MNRALTPVPTIPSSATPESILDHKYSRVINIDANIIAYFADYFHALKQGLSGKDSKSQALGPITALGPSQALSATPATYDHTAQSNTASAHNPS